MKTAVALLAVATALALAVPASAELAYWNGHCYEARYRPDGITWGDAQAECEADGGHLAVINSEAENDFCFDLAFDVPDMWFLDGFNNGIGPWLGGAQAEGAEEPGGGWGWVNGDPWTWTHWAYGEPNNGSGSLGGEDRLHFMCYQCLRAETWNDLLSDDLPLGYIFEFDGDCAVPAMRSTWGTIKTLYR